MGLSLRSFALTCLVVLAVLGPPAHADGRLSPQGGTITAVAATAGGGLTGGATAGVAYLGLITTCSDTQVLKWSSGSAAWGCASAGSGTVTSITAGSGLSGGVITATGTIALAINGGTTQTCGAGTFVSAITGVGITTCTTPSSGITNTAGNNIVMKSNGTNAVASSISDDATSVIVGTNALKITESTGSLEVGSGAMHTWSSTSITTGTPDVALARNAAGILEVDNGTAGTFAALKLSNLTASGTGAFTSTLTADGGLRVVDAVTAAFVQTANSIDLATLVTAGSCTNCSLTADKYGRITGFSIGTSPVTAISVTSPITSTGGLTPTIGLSLTTTSCSAGSHVSAISATGVGTCSADAGGVTGTGAANATTKWNGTGSITSGWASDDSTTWGTASKFIITEASGNFHGYGTGTVDGSLTANSGNTVFDVVGTGLARDGTNAYQVNLNMAGASCSAGSFVSAITATGGTTCTAAGGTISGLSTNATVKAASSTTLTNGWASDDGTTWGTTGKFTIAEATGNVVASGTINVAGNVAGSTSTWTSPTTSIQALISGSALTSGANAIEVENTVTYNTTGSAITARAGRMYATGTRSSGANPLTNITLELTASGGQVNTALNVVAGTSVLQDMTATTGSYSALLTATAAIAVSGGVSSISGGLSISGKETYNDQLEDIGTLITCTSGCTVASNLGASSGTVTATSTSMTTSFAITFTHTPTCVLSGQGSGKSFTYTVSTSAISWTSVTSTQKYDFICIGH